MRLMWERRRDGLGGGDVRLDGLRGLDGGAGMGGG